MRWLNVAYDWYQLHKGPFELLGMFLAVVGTFFAVLSIQDGKKMTRDLRAVFDHLTTKAVGPYPDFMPELERLIASARDSIVIACDFPGYGVWSDRGRYASFLKALENRKAERVRAGASFDVQLLVLDAAGRRRALNEHFPERSWRDYVRRGTFTRSRRLYEGLENAQVSDERHEFLDQLAARHQRALDADLRFAERWETAQQIPVHLFIADGERALFSIPGGGGEAREFGFVSEETGLVRALSAIWDRYLAEAKHVEDEEPVAKVPRMRAS